MTRIVSIAIVLFFLTLIPVYCLSQTTDSLYHSTYTAYTFAPEEKWNAGGKGNIGETKLKGKTLQLDFTQGAQRLDINAPDFSLLGSIEKIHFRIHGTVKGHPVRLTVHTHFMTFYKDIGEFGSAGEQVLSTEGPPGPGWKWQGGENDGKIHGPLRLTQISFMGNGLSDNCTLELIDMKIDANCPINKKCVLTARTKEKEGRNYFVTTIRTLSKKPVEGILRWTIHNWTGDELERGERKVSIPPVTNPVITELPVPVNQYDYKFLEARFTLDVPGQETYPADACWVAPHVPHGDIKLDPSSSFGMDLRISWHEGEERERVAQMAQDAGVKWSREPFDWSRIQPKEGVFEWGYYDAVMDCAKRNGISLYVLVHGWAEWTEPYTEKSIEQYLVSLKALVNRYKGFVKHWEIWNEPNIFFWQGPKEMYPELLKRAYAVIKETDPDAQVLGISTAGIGWDFIKMVLAKNAPFDILTIHPYRRILEDQKFIDELKKVFELVRMPDRTPRPVWITEMGWTTYTPHHTIRQGFRPVTLREQAQLISREYLCALVSGIDPKTSWYNFRDSGEEPLDFEHGLGTIFRDFRPKPSYIAYSTLTRILKGMKPDKKIDTGDSAFAYQFVSGDGSGKITIALWNPDKDTEVVLRLGYNSIIIINTIGEEKEIRGTNGEFKISLKKGAPIYLLKKS